jgi:hypothetical protein
MTNTNLNPAIKPIEFLLGKWSGEGQGEYPTIEPFRYREEIDFSHNGKPFLIYNQRTRAFDEDQPMHTEAGYLRSVGNGAVEFVIAQPIGYAEISIGRVEGTRLDVQCESVSKTPTAKNVTAISRSVWLEGDQLHSETRMGMDGRPPTRHLKATFRRVDQPADGD